MTERVRIKRPTWDDIDSNSEYTLATVESDAGNDLYMLNGGDYVDISEALSFAKDITGEELAITSLGIYGCNARGGEYQVNTTLYPDYEEANRLCLCFTFNETAYAIGLTNNTADCH